MRVQELREQRANRITTMRGLIETAEREKRDMTEDESRRFDALKAETTGLESRIAQRETLDAFDRVADADPLDPGDGSRRDLSNLEARFSIGKAISEHMSRGGRLTGAEAEWNAEHRSTHEGITAPISHFLGSEQRYVGTTQPSAGPGGALVATSLGPLIDRPRPNLATQQLGATILTGLRDFLDLPRLKSSGSAYWVGEHEDTTGSDPAFDKVSMGPKTVTGRYETSRRMLIQAPQIEQILRQDLGFLLAQALDSAAIQGTGASNSPKGITNTAGVKKVTKTYAGAHATTAELDGLFQTMKAIVEFADIGGSTGFLAHPAVKAKLNGYRTDAGDLIGVQGFLQDEPVAWSTQIGSFLGENTNLARIIFGNWSDLVIGYWSAVDLFINPYAKEMSDKGGAYIYAYLDADVAVRHPESFSYTDTFPTSFGAGGSSGSVTVNS